MAAKTVLPIGCLKKSMLDIVCFSYLFSTDLVKVWVLEPIPYPALFCVCIKENVVCQKMAPHQLFKPAVKMNSTKHQKSGEYWK